MSHSLRAMAAAMLGLGTIAAAPVALAPARATYEVSLVKGLPGGAVSVRGRTVIEFRTTCDGYETTQRFLADTADPDNNVSRSDFLVKTWESRTGGTMRFDVTNMVDGAVAERYVGQAKRDDEAAGEVDLTTPNDTNFALPGGTVFPTMQTAEVLKAAQAGQRSYSGPVFQGGGPTDLYFSTTVIGKELPAGGAARESVSGDADLLNGTPAWPVLMSYFPDGKDGETPEYEVAADLYANGVIGSMTLIYARFTLKAQLVKVERLSAPAC